jgi:hypothetical protein
MTVALRGRTKAGLVSANGYAWFFAHYRFLRLETARGPDGVFFLEIYEVIP